jgi:predicted GNAT family acetyltransferase
MRQRRLHVTARVLDRPVWNTLAGRHAQLSIGGERARRFAPDVGPLAGTRDDEPESLAALAELVPADGTLLLLQADPIVLPPETVATTTALGVQMILDRLVDVAPDPRIVPLTRDDAPAMLALATLTKPGPFGPRTRELGEFFGVKDHGELVAMAGERMKHDGFSEVSGVCTHASARGRGLARTLSAHVARRVLDRGDVPYLHAYATNTVAIQLYESLGFRVHRNVHVAAIACVSAHRAPADRDRTPA